MKRIKHVVKRRGNKEPYDQRKMYASVYSAALNCHYKEQKAQKIAENVTKKINSWIKNKKLVTSREIRNKVIESTKDKDVILMYKHHLDLS